MEAKAILGAFAASGLLLATVPAMAAAPEACSSLTGIAAGTSNVSNVMLGGASALHCYISDVNAQGGPGGTTSAFTTDSDFGTGWSLLAKIENPTNLATFGGVNYTITFAQTTSKNGTWTITSSQNVAVDLVFAMHAGGRTGSFLFDDMLVPTSGKNGTWEIKWPNPSGKSIPDYSNLTIFARDQVIQTPVPEPETYAMLVAGLGLLGLMARRRRPA